MRTCRNLCLFAGLALIARTAFGLGLGELTLNSFVNEPLKAQVELLDVGGLQPEDIRIRLATQEDFDRLGVERAYFLTKLRFDVVFDASGARIDLTADEPLVEPYLDFLIEARWPAGRLLREYTVLVDLPPTASIMESATSERPDGTNTVVRSDVPAPLAATNKPVDRQYDRDAQPVPAAGGRYLVTREDTLWKIASSAALPGISVEQTMLATVAMNPRAFAGGNINGLKAGYVLALPTEADLSMGVSEAISAVKSQNSDWTAGITSQPVLRVVADSDLDQQVEAEPTAEALEDGGASVLGSSDADVADTLGEAASGLLPADPSDDSSQPEGGMTSPSVADPAEILGSDEENRASLALVEAQLADLSGQIGNLRELVAIKDRQIAELQASIAARQQPVKVSGQLGGMHWLVFLAAGIFLGALALVLGQWLRRKGQAAEPEDIEDSIDQPPTAATDTFSREPESGAIGDAPPDLDAAASEALAEAKVYVSYGRHQQAINILSAVASEGTGHAAAELYCKMIAIAVDNDRREEAMQWLKEVEVNGSEEQIARATNVINENEIELPDLGELEDAGIGLESNQSSIPPISETSNSMGAGIDLQGEAVLTADNEAIAAPASHISQSSDVEPLVLDPDWPVGSVDEASKSSELEAVEATQTEAEALSDSALPPELAAVLGTDVAPPPEEPAELEAEGLVYATETDPMDAKLDLARAYIDMGDEEGARPILEDVVTNGDLRQQAEARELLVHID